MWFPIGIFQSPNFSLREGSKKNLILLRQGVYHSSLTGASTARFDFVVTMFRVENIDEDTVDCPRFVAFKGASREDSSSGFNLGQLTKRIHGESDEFDEEEARLAQRKDRRRRAPFYLESPIGFTFTWNRPLCAVLMLLGGGGGAKKMALQYKNKNGKLRGRERERERWSVRVGDEDTGGEREQLAIMKKKTVNKLFLWKKKKNGEQTLSLNRMNEWSKFPVPSDNWHKIFWIFSFIQTVHHTQNSEPTNPKTLKRWESGGEAKRKRPTPEEIMPQ